MANRRHSDGAVRDDPGAAAEGGLGGASERKGDQRVTATSIAATSCLRTACQGYERCRRDGQRLRGRQVRDAQIDRSGRTQRRGRGLDSREMWRRRGKPTRPGLKPVAGPLPKPVVWGHDAKIRRHPVTWSNIRVRDKERPTLLGCARDCRPRCRRPRMLSGPGLAWQ